MIRRVFAITSFLGAFGVASGASAQWKQTLRTEGDADAFCRCSEPKTTVAELDAGEARQQEVYETERRSRAQRPVIVTVAANAAPVVGYDRTTGSLSISLYQPARFSSRHAVKVGIGAVEFELPEATAHQLHARYEAGTAALRLTVLPLAWSDNDRPLCNKEGDLKILAGEILEAELVDEIGQTLASFRSELGREVAMMREHRVQGYLDSAVPVVTVSSLTPFPAQNTPLPSESEARIKAALRSSLYGCYLRGLTRNARLQGALVVQMSMTADEAPRILVDSLQNDATTDCATQRIGEFVRLQHSVPAETSLKATVIFKLEEAPNL